MDGHVTATFELEPDETTTIPLLSGEGNGELRIDSSDVNTPISTISLYSIANEAPIIEILSPQNGDIHLGPASSLKDVFKTIEIFQKLLMQWRSSVDGGFGNTNASDDGLHTGGVAGRTFCRKPHYSTDGNRRL